MISTPHPVLFGW